MSLLRFKKDDPDYRFLSNYYPCSFVLDGIYYLNAEAAFQAQKVPPEERRQFACLMPNEAKRLGRRVQLPPNWDKVRDEAMRRVLYAKFSQNEEFKQRLLETGSQHIIEDTTGWHDNYWGDCQCPKCRDTRGQNKLGLMLEETRTTLQIKGESYEQTECY